MTDKDLKAYCEQTAQAAKKASRILATIQSGRIDDWLKQAADRLESASGRILDANGLDVAKRDDFGLTDAQVDRLMLNPERITAIANGLRNIAHLDSPIGEIFESTVRPNGLMVNRIRVPLGVIFFIYESRPNVTADAAAIAVKSQNAIILRGGKEAMFSSQAIVDILKESAAQSDLPADVIQLVSTVDRDAVDHFLGLADLIDLAIPRGGEALIRRVVANAAMPVIKHFSGNCHVYVDRQADQDTALRIVINSKCQRMGVCNAAESLLIHQEIAETFLPRVARELLDRGIEIRGDQTACRLVTELLPASPEDHSTEFLGPVISVAIVNDLQQAIDHINRFGSGHTDAIVSQDFNAIQHFSQQVDSAAVMVNASTRFNDGGEFGLGAEIGISTDKFHARGPCGLKELTTYKYVCIGNGQTR